MRKIEFAAPFGENQKNVKLSAPMGAGGGFQILIECYYRGMITKINSQWVAHLNDNSELTGDDILILGQRIDGEF